jgi:S1-C subfamily serine protease
MSNVLPPGEPPASQSKTLATTPPPSRSRRARILAAVAAVVLFVGPAVLGYELGHDGGSGSSNTSIESSAFDPGSASNGSTSNGSIDIEAIADELDDSVVNITTTLASGNQAAGSGIIISSSGLVLTNNHVIADSTDIEAEVGATGKTYSGKVLGYDIAEDVALVQLENASRLDAVETANSSTLTIGETVIAIGNAGGGGGPPSVVSGEVTGLDEQITASEADGSNSQMLTDLIETNANIQSGDSGGPLIDGNGDVVGMNAAASSRNGRAFGFGQTDGNEGYAIPIENALAIAEAIRSGDGGDGIHIGGDRAVIGVSVQDDSSARGPLGGSGRTGRGAAVVGIQAGSGADRAGIQEGDTITAIDGKAVTSANALTDAMTAYSPGDSVKVTWVDESGTSHDATVKLGSGPPA